MTFEQHLTEFAGLPVLRFPTGPEPLPPDAGGPCAWHVASFVDYDGDSAADFGAVFRDFLERVDTAGVEALVVGACADSGGKSPVEVLVEAAPRFPRLRALFYGDILREQCDVAYICHQPLTPIIEAFPGLTEFWVRGRPDQEDVPLVGPVRHDRLRVLGFQSGGLPSATIRAVGECEFPELEHLEFYFGTPDYGGDGTPDDVAWLLAGDRFPKLRRLGLRDSVRQDELAAAVAHAPVVARLEVLDLSLGTLGDEGAAALLAGQPLGHLRRLDLHHHFITAPMIERLRSAWPGVEVDVSDAIAPHGRPGLDGTPRPARRYIAISE